MRTTTLLTIGVAAIPLALTIGGCADSGGDQPAPAVDDKIRIDTQMDGSDPSFREFEIKGPNLYFWCDGTYGIYVTEGSNGDSGKSAAPFVIENHRECMPG